jgi:hypothetical protein
MTKKVDTYLVDDLDGSLPAETVIFGINGTEYAIDLAAHNAREFFDKLDCYIKAGRRLGPGRGRGGRQGRRSQQRHQKLQAARVWLRERGHEISDRGRIPRRLLDEFEAAEAGRI